MVSAFEETRLVKALGDAIGYGRIMQLSEQLWRVALEAEDCAGGEHSAGPAAAFLVPCGCVGADILCDWCCGTGRVTKRVRQAQIDEEPDGA